MYVKVTIKKQANLLNEDLKFTLFFKQTDFKLNYTKILNICV